MKTEKPTTACSKQPIANLCWVRPTELRANGYNPNKVFPPELQLLKISILRSGWTQPVVALSNGEIVDGFHRWTLASKDWEVLGLTDGLVPIVFISPENASEQMMATVRHNRARGQHGIIKMGNIVRDLLAEGSTKEQVMELLQMEEEEVERLAETKGAPDRVGKDSFGRGWVPDTPEAAKSVTTAQRPPRNARNGAQDAKAAPPGPATVKTPPASKRRR